MDKQFLNKLKSQFTKIEGVTLDAAPPRYWFSTGNAALNKIVSDDFRHGIPQGRVTGVCGPSGHGKSFTCANIMREAQNDGAFVLAIDTENALDNTFLGKIGVDTENNYLYVSAITIPQVIKIVSEFIKSYKATYGDAVDAPKVLIVLDSLDMLLTETEFETYQKGDQKGDQGQKNKQIKAMLKTFVQDIKTVNVSMIVTHHVYPATAQQLLEGEGQWVVSKAVRYSLSQIILCTRLKLKDSATKQITGIRMKCEAFKSRFSAPFQTVTIEVPYETGMDPNSGLQELLETNGVLTRGGSWYSVPGTDIRFQSKNFDENVDAILAHIEAQKIEVKGAVERQSPIEDDVHDDE